MSSHFYSETRQSIPCSSLVECDGHRQTPDTARQTSDPRARISGLGSRLSARAISRVPWPGILVRGSRLSDVASSRETRTAPPSSCSSPTAPLRQGEGLASRFSPRRLQSNLFGTIEIFALVHHFNYYKCLINFHQMTPRSWRMA